MVDATISDEQLAELVRETEEAASAYIRGDVDRYLELIEHAPGFTLSAPYGGPVTRHADRAPEVRESAGSFKGGEATLEHVETHVWGDTVVVAMIERQHGHVGDLPEQDWSLRVTHVYRREGSQWLLVHRHADPLVNPIAMTTMAALARGEL